MRYVVGFLFCPSERYVALIKKARPDWQKGKLNGIGGKIEPGESPYDAMCREFKEEVGMTVVGWQLYAVLFTGGHEVIYFRATSTNIPMEWDIRINSDEPIVIETVKSLSRNVLNDVKWLVPMALSINERMWPILIQENYSVPYVLTESVVS